MTEYALEVGETTARVAFSILHLGVADTTKDNVPHAGRDLPRAFRTAYLWVNSRCGLPFQIFLTDLLRSPVLKPGVPPL